MPKKKAKTKKKTAKRPRAKETAKRAAKKTAKKAARKKTAAKKRPSVSAKRAPKAPAQAAQPPIPGTPVGKVTHYFPHVNAAVVKVEGTGIKIGDRLRFKGHTTDFEQVVTSLQIDRSPLDSARAGAEVGVEVKDRVREDDTVYKL